MTTDQDGSRHEQTPGGQPVGGAVGTRAARAALRPPTRVRWVLVWLCFAGTAINYVDRANLSIAAPFIQRDFHLSDAAMGLVLGAFFWTYAVCQLPSGWLVDKLGPRLMYSAAVLWWSLFTALSALATGFASLFGLRLGLGIGESAAYPSNAKVVARWFPVRERAFATSIYDSGARVGTALSVPLVALIIVAVGWRWSFVITGVVGALWVLFWVWQYRNPREHARASAEEIDYIDQGGGRVDEETSQAGADGTRWAQLFTYRTIWGMMLGFFCLNFVIYFFITWFPSYLVEARHFSLLKLGFAGAIPALVAIVGGWAGGLFSDRLIRRGVSVTKARKIPMVGGMLFSSVIALAVVVPNGWVALGLLAICYASLTFAGASVWSLPADVAPSHRHVASIGGIQNFASNLAGIGSPLLLGELKGITGSFVLPLILTGAVAVVGALSYGVIVGRIAPLPPRSTTARAGAVEG
jgi:MFS transporter, ACS family, D-galactonate transporter